MFVTRYSTSGCGRSYSDSNPGILSNSENKVKTPGTVNGTLGSKSLKEWKNPYMDIKTLLVILWLYLLYNIHLPGTSCWDVQQSSYSRGLYAPEPYRMVFIPFQTIYTHPPPPHKRGETRKKNFEKHLPNCLLFR